MSAKILVAYASRAGSTASIAEAIGTHLRAGGANVEVSPMAQVSDLAPYRAVVAGSAIQGGKWLPEAMSFLHTYQAELRCLPFAAFLVCITMGMKNPTYRAGVTQWMAPVRAVVRPMSEGLFAGVLDFSSAPKSLDMLKLRLAAKVGLLPQGDHRDWAAIEAWTKSLSL